MLISDESIESNTHPDEIITTVFSRGVWWYATVNGRTLRLTLPPNITPTTHAYVLVTGTYCEYLRNS